MLHVLLAAILTPLCPPAPAASSVRDPKDGPDVDLAIAIEDGEVRLRIITNLAFLDATCDVFREVAEHLDGPEVDDAHQQLFELFRAQNRVRIDGVEVAPVGRGFDLDPGASELVAHYPRFGALAVYKTRLTLAYPCKEPPREVAVKWGVYPPNAVLEDENGDAPPIEVLCRLSADGLQHVVRFRRDEPEFTWHRPAEATQHLIPVPELARASRAAFPWAWVLGALGAAVVAFTGPRAIRRVAGVATVGLAAFAALAATEDPGAALPDAEEAVAIFEPLHSNIYRAFDYTAPEDVYDALAASVDGGLLDHLYDEVYRSLVMQEQGGAVSRVERVRHLETTVEDIGWIENDEGARRTGFRVEARWQVDGAVVHWGHAHTRTNEYRAQYTVAATPDGWRITDSRVLEQERVDAAPLPDGSF